MKIFIKVLDAIIDTDWLVSCYLNKDHTLLNVRQSENITLEFAGTPDELESAFDSIWNQIKEVNAKVEEGVMTRQGLEEWAVENEVELVFLDDGDDAIVGLGNDGQGFHVIYSMQKFIDSLVRSGMTEEDAYELYSYNTIGSIPSIGTNRPIMLEL
jgi:hypothetical protein